MDHIVDSDANPAKTKVRALLKGKLPLTVRSALLVVFLSCELLLFSIILLVVEQRINASFIEEFSKYGLSATQSLKTINNDMLAAGDYKGVEKVVQQILHGNDQMLYAAVLLPEHSITGFKPDSNLQDIVLSGNLYENALRTDEPLVQHSQSGLLEFADIAQPLIVNGAKFGVVRAGFDFSQVREAISSTRFTLLLIAAIGFLSICIASILLARRISAPLDQLVKNAQAVGAEHFDKITAVKAFKEIGDLGSQLTIMQNKLRYKLNHLAEDNRQLMQGNQQLHLEIAEREKKDAQIRYLAFYDSMTHLPNRELLKMHLTHRLAAAKRQQTPVAVLFLDLDHFKRINDTLGHKTGDELLREVAQRLSRCISQGSSIIMDKIHAVGDDQITSNNNTVARLAGDEFVVVLADIKTLDDALIAAHRINQMLAIPFVLGERQLFVTSSIGISSYPADGDDAETLLKHADIAMYHAKELGRHGYQIYSSAMDAHIQERLALETSLRESLKKKHFQVYYQPKAHTQSGRIVGAEALVRWGHPDKGFISPEKFIPIAEETGLIISLGEWVLRTACEQAMAWQAAGLPPVKMSVNLSVAQFKQQNLPEVVKEVLQETGLNPKYLELELTESLLMENLDTTISMLNQLKAIGLNLSIDDFGTGYSSLSYLKRLPIDTLKIDQSFVRDLENDANDAAIVTATIALGHKLKLKVIAEGVENAIQLKLLQSYRCDEIQGYLLSRPLPADAFGEYLHSSQARLAKLRPRTLKAVK